MKTTTVLPISMVLQFFLVQLKITTILYTWQPSILFSTTSKILFCFGFQIFEFFSVRTLVLLIFYFLRPKMPISLSSPMSTSSPVVNQVLERKRRIFESNDKFKWSMINFLAAVILFLEAENHLLLRSLSPW